MDIQLLLYNNVSDEELINYYNSARITAYTPVQEPFGLVPLESMACGTPVIAVKEGGIQESILHGQTGLLVERDPLLFSEALQSLLTNQSLLDEYSRKGRDHILKYWTWDKAVATIDEYLISSVR